jgi:hypothetical protein
MLRRHHEADHLLLRTILQSCCSGARAAHVVGEASLPAEGEELGRRHATEGAPAAKCWEGSRRESWFRQRGRQLLQGCGRPDDLDTEIGTSAIDEDAARWEARRDWGGELGSSGDGAGRCGRLRHYPCQRRVDQAAVLEDLAPILPPRQAPAASSTKNGALSELAGAASVHIGRAGKQGAGGGRWRSAAWGKRGGIGVGQRVGAGRRGQGGGRPAERTDTTKRARGVRSGRIRESAVCRKYVTDFFVILPPCQLIPDGGSSYS